MLGGICSGLPKKPPRITCGAGVDPWMARPEIRHQPRKSRRVRVRVAKVIMFSSFQISQARIGRNGSSGFPPKRSRAARSAAPPAQERGPAVLRHVAEDRFHPVRAPPRTARPQTKRRPVSRLRAASPRASKSDQSAGTKNGLCGCTPFQYIGSRTLRPPLTPSARNPWRWRALRRDADEAGRQTARALTPAHQQRHRARHRTAILRIPQPPVGTRAGTKVAAATSGPAIYSHRPALR